MKELSFKKWDSARFQFIQDQLMHGDNDCDINNIIITENQLTFSVDCVYYLISKESLSNEQNIGLEELNDIILIMDQHELTEMIKKSWMRDQISQLFLHDLESIINESLSLKLIHNNSDLWFKEYSSKLTSNFIQHDASESIPLNVQEQENDIDRTSERRVPCLGGLSRILLFLILFSFSDSYAGTIRGELLMSIDNDKVSKHINKIYDDAETVCKKYDIPIGILIAKSIVENFHKKSCLQDSKFNYLGIMSEIGCMRFHSRIHCFEYWAKIISKDCHQDLQFKTLNGWIYALSCNGSLQSSNYRSMMRKVIKKYNLNLTMKQ